MSNVYRFASQAVMLTCAVGLLASGETTHADNKDKKDTVELQVDYGDGSKRSFTNLPWKKDMTILTAMESVKKHPRGVTFKYRGKGKTGFLFQIDDLKNEGSGSNWVYRVNDELGETSFAVHKLKPGDVVLWKFGKYR